MAIDDPREFLIELFARQLRPYAIAVRPLQGILHEAAKRAGWRPPSAKVRDRQRAAARGRTLQREDDLALRRVLVSIVFKDLPRHLRQKPSSTGTAQAIIGRLEKLRFDRPPQ
jgi:hypothetical protein